MRIGPTVMHSSATDLSLVYLQFDGDLEGEEQLVFLEDPRTSVVVQVERVGLRDVTKTLAQVRVRQTLV